MTVVEFSALAQLRVQPGRAAIDEERDVLYAETAPRIDGTRRPCEWRGPARSRALRSVGSPTKQLGVPSSSTVMFFSAKAEPPSASDSGYPVEVANRCCQNEPAFRLGAAQRVRFSNLPDWRGCRHHLRRRRRNRLSSGVRCGAGHDRLGAHGHRHREPAHLGTAALAGDLARRLRGQCGDERADVDSVRAGDRQHAGGGSRDRSTSPCPTVRLQLSARRGRSDLRGYRRRRLSRRERHDRHGNAMCGWRSVVATLCRVVV